MSPSTGPMRRLYRLAVALLYRNHPERARLARELDVASVACIERERRHLGAIGVGYAWLRLAQDLLTAAAAMRLDRRRAARIEAVRNPTPRKDGPMTTLSQDIRYALRGFRRAPLFNGVLIGALALATGATTTLFGVVDAVLLKPLPYRDAHRLVMLYEAIGSSGPIGFSAPDYDGIRSRVKSFESIAAFRNRQLELSGVSRPDRITAAAVSSGLFGTLGVLPSIGRDFTREDDEGNRPVAILSDGLWRSAFGADPSALGRAILLDRRPYTIVGVMPRGFTFPNRGPHLNNLPADVYVPISFSAGERGGFGSMYNNSVIGRLTATVTAAGADAEIRAVASGLVREIYPAELQGLRLAASATPLREETVGRIQTILYVLFAAVVVVLLIACADIASLMLTRAATREREMAVRAALGAGRGRLIAQSLVETGTVAAGGGLLGALLAWWATTSLAGFAPADVPRLHEIAVDLRVLAFAVAITALTALLCGLLPAIELSRHGAGDALKEGGRTAAPGRRQRRIFSAIVTAQFALAAVLLAAGGLLVRSFVRLTFVDPGFQPDRVLTLATSLPAAAYPRGSDVRRFYAAAFERLEQLPGVASVAASTFLPLSVRERRAFTMEAPTAAFRDSPRTVAHDWVSGQYFETLGIALRSGRYLAAEDVQGSEPVIVINATMARRYWPDADPVGQRIAWGGSANHGPWMRIVGIVADVKQGALQTVTVPQTYQPWVQVSDAFIADNVVGALRSLKIAVRTRMDPSALTSSIREQLRAIDAALPITALQTMNQVVATSTGPQRFNTVLLGSFAALALLLAGLGIAGVLATSVARRTPEIGIRMALGARPGDLLRMVVGHGMALAAAGLTLGVAASLALTRFMSTLLFEISPRDPATFAVVAAMLLGVALFASYIPARRATRVDPMVALKRE